MMANIKMFIIFLMLAFAYTTYFNAIADTGRCPNGDIVETGDKVFEVTIKCGELTRKSKRILEGGPYGGISYGNVEIEE